MSDYAVGALGYPGFGTTDYQALAAIMNTPNPNAQVAFRGGAQTQTQTTAQPQVQYVQQEKKNSKAPVVLGVIAVAGAAACLWAASKGNADLKGFAKVKDGFKVIGNSLKGKAATTTTSATKTAEEVVIQGKRTIQDIGGKKVVTLPGEKNIISTVASKKCADVSELGKIGEKVDIGKLSERFEKVTKDGVTTWKVKEGNEVRSFVLEHVIPAGKANKGTYKIIGARGGEITIVKDGKKFICDSHNAKFYSQLEEMGKEVFAGKTDPSTLKQVIMRSTNKETGLIATIKAEGGKESLLSAVTDRFSTDSKKVKYLKATDSKFKEALETFLDPKKRGKGLDIAVADVIVSSDRNITFTVDGAGNVLKVQFKDKKGQKVVLDAVKDKEDFIIFKDEHLKTFEKVATSDKKTWFNKILEV